MLKKSSRSLVHYSEMMYLRDAPPPSVKVRKQHRTGTRAFIVAGIGLVALGLLSFAGCQNKKTVPSAGPSVVAQSAIKVRTSSDGIVVHTPTAEFTLSPSGALKAALQKDHATSTLDALSVAPSQVITLGKRDYSVVTLDTARASVK